MFADFESLGVTLLGVSRDSAAREKSFGEKLGLPFPLLADPEGKIIAAYGVAKLTGPANRVTFVIGPDGKIFRVFSRVNPRKHAPEVLAAVREAVGR